MPSITLTRVEAQKLVDFCKKHGSEKFYIAKDQGAYLGYNKGAEQCLFYFKGCNPNINPGFWDEGQRLFGGDDFGEFLPILSIERALDPTVVKVKVTVNTRSIKIEAFTK